MNEIDVQFDAAESRWDVVSHSDPMRRLASFYGEDARLWALQHAANLIIERQSSDRTFGGTTAPEKA